MGILEDISSEEDFELINNMNNRKQYTEKQRPDHYIEWDDVEYYRRFRLSKRSVRYLVELIETAVTHPTERMPVAAVLHQPAAPAPQEHVLVAAAVHNVAKVVADLDEPVAPAPQDHAMVSVVLEPAAAAFHNVAQVVVVLNEPAAPSPQHDALVNEQAGDLWDQLVQQNPTESSSDEEGDDSATLDDWRVEGEDIEFNDGMPIQFRCSFEDSKDSYDSDHKEEPEQEHHSESETDGADSDDEPLFVSTAAAPTLSGRYYLGRDKTTKWFRAPPAPNVRTRRQNLITMNTNIYVPSIGHRFSRERDSKQTDEAEVKAVIGLLIIAGSFRAGNQNRKDLWDQNGLGVDIFTTAMSMKRFLFLLRSFRLADVRNRAQRREIDRLAPIREVFQLFLLSWERYFSVFAYTTIDDQLDPFRGRCSLRQYIPSKPAKIQTICGGRIWYILGMEAYVGKQPSGLYEVSNSPFDLVKRLVRPIEYNGRNVTVDNWFGSIPLTEHLLTKNLTNVGTLRKNKMELPLNFVVIKNREEKSSLFGFQKNATLVSYVPKKNKIVILLSTVHNG
ncbi:hypothetical protein CBL_08411 [Carabus blaptoides fortunei]